MAKERKEPESTPTPAESPKDDAAAAKTQTATESQAAPAAELDLTPVIKKDDEDVPFETLSFEAKPGSRIDAKVQVEEPVFEKRLESILKDLRRNVVVDGFRRGHAPIRMLRNLYGKEAQIDALEKMKESIIPSLAKEKGWEVLGEAEVTDSTLEPGKPAQVTYSFEILPKVEVPDDVIKSISVDVEKHDVTDDRVEEEIEKLRQANATFEAKAENASFDPETDGIAVDVFVTDASGNNVSQLSRMDDFLPKPKDLLPPEVVDAIKGKKAGTHVDVKVSTAGDPETDQAKQEPLDYHVDLKSIKTLRLPALDDEFAKDINAKFSSLDDLRKDIRRDLEEQEQQRRRNESLANVLKALMEKVPVDVPKSLVATTAASRIDREERMLRQYGLGLSQVLGDRVGEFVERVTGDAEASVKADLLLRSVAQRLGVEVTDEEMDKEFARLAEQAGRSPMAIRAQFEARKQLDDLKDQLRRRKVEDHILQHAKVKLVAPAKEKSKPAAETKKTPKARTKPKADAEPKKPESKKAEPKKTKAKKTESEKAGS